MGISKIVLLLFQRKRVAATFTFAAITLAALSGLPSGGASVYGRNASPLFAGMPDPVPSPDRLQFNGALSKGKFLVASRGIGDFRFRETVILLIKYDRTGAAGVIINKPTEVRLSAVFPEIEALQKTTDTLFIGGPVARNQMFMLIRSGSSPGESLHVFRNIYVSSSMAVLKRIVDDRKATEKFRVYEGYAGWTFGQLEREVLRGDWHIMEADEETLFKKDSSSVWPELIRRGSVMHVRLPVHNKERL